MTTAKLHSFEINSSNSSPITIEDKPQTTALDLENKDNKLDVSEIFNN